MTKTPRELFEEHAPLAERDRQAEIKAELEVRTKREERREPAQAVNCKSCGAVIDVSEDPENWPLQCDPCKRANVPLPKGYEQLGGHR